MKGKGACNCLMWIAATPQTYILCMMIILVDNHRLYGEGARKTYPSSGGIAITTLAREKSLDLPKLEAVRIPYV